MQEWSGPSAATCAPCSSQTSHTWRTTSGPTQGNARTGATTAPWPALRSQTSSSTSGNTRVKSPTSVTTAPRHLAGTTSWLSTNGCTRARRPTHASSARQSSASGRHLQHTFAVTTPRGTEPLVQAWSERTLTCWHNKHPKTSIHFLRVLCTRQATSLVSSVWSVGTYRCQWWVRAYTETFFQEGFKFKTTLTVPVPT